MIPAQLSPIAYIQVSYTEASQALLNFMNQPDKPAEIISPNTSEG